MRVTVSLIALLAVGQWSEAAAQSAPPVPTESTDRTERPTPRGAENSAPGFDPPPPPPADAPAPAPRGRLDGPGRNERFVEALNRTRGEIGLDELIDEILADVMAVLDRMSSRRLSPLAIRQVALGANVNPAFARRLRAKVSAQLHAGTRIKLIRCLECEATRSRVEDGHWIITHGLVSNEDLRQVGARIGAAAFMDVAFGFDPELGVVEMSFEVIRARDAKVLWAETLRADETTAMLYRASDEPLKREDRLRDLQMLLEGRPFFGIVATTGIMLLPYDDPVDGDIFGATAGLRVHERFGTERRLLFGLDLQGFFNPSRIAGGLLSAGLWWIPLRPDLTTPEFRVGGKAGTFLAGSEGNAAIFQLGAELLLRYRFGVYAYALLMTESTFNGFTLGGADKFGVASGVSVNW